MNKHISLNLREYSLWKRKVTDPKKYRHQNIEEYKECALQLEDMIENMKKLEKFSYDDKKYKTFKQIRNLINDEDFTLKRRTKSMKFMKF